MFSCCHICRAGRHTEITNEKPGYQPLKKEATKQRSEKDQAAPNLGRQLESLRFVTEKKGRAFAPFQPWRLVSIQLLWFSKGENHHKLQESHCAYRKHRTEGSPEGTIQHLTSVQPVIHSNTRGCCADTVSLTLCTHSFTKQSPDPWGIQS